MGVYENTNTRVSPTWVRKNLTIPVISLADGDVFYYNSTKINRLAKGSDGDRLELASGLPSWVSSEHRATMTAS